MASKKTLRTKTARGKRAARKPIRSTDVQPKTASSANSEQPIPTELLAGLADYIIKDVSSAISELCAAARVLNRQGVSDGSEFILAALGRIDAASMTALELRGVVRRDLKAVAK